jgi:hypothetical protein
MPDRKHIADEVKFHVEHRIPVWNCAGAQSAWTHIQRHLPPVIQQRHVNHADLADDLGPHMQGVAGGRPFVHHQGWPVEGPHGAVHIVSSHSSPSPRTIDSVKALPIMYATL